MAQAVAEGGFHHTKVGRSGGGSWVLMPTYPWIKLGHSGPPLETVGDLRIREQS